MTNETKKEDLNKAATTREEASEQLQKQELKRKQLMADIKWVMETPAGMRLMQNVMARGGIFLNDFNENSKIHAFNSGNKNLVLSILKDIEVAAPHKLRELLVPLG